MLTDNTITNVFHAKTSYFIACLLNGRVVHHEQIIILKMNGQLQEYKNKPQQVDKRLMQIFSAVINIYLSPEWYNESQFTGISCADDFKTSGWIYIPIPIGLIDYTNCNFWQNEDSRFFAKLH